MDSSSKEVLISNGKSALHYWREIWQSRELFWILAKRDILVRYKQTVLGVAWSIIRPLLTALVMVFAFGKIAKLDEDTSIAYMLVVMPGVIVWLVFSQSLAQISNSIVGNTNLVSKVYLFSPFDSSTKFINDWSARRHDCVWAFRSSLFLVSIYP